MPTSITAFPIITRRVGELPAAALPLLTTDSVMVSRDGVKITDCTVADILALAPTFIPTVDEFVVSGASYTLSKAPTTGFMVVFLNGVLQKKANFENIGAAFSILGLNPAQYKSLTVVYL